MSNPWFRLYAEFATDPKVQMLSEADQRRFIMLLCLRCGNGDVTLHDEEIAFQLRISNEEWKDTKRTLVAKNLVDESSRPTAWEKRQFESDSSAARVRSHRKRLKQACNVTVTPRARKTDTDTDTDTESAVALSAPARDVSAEQEIPPTPAAMATRPGALAGLLRQHGVSATPQQPHLLAWVDAELSDAEALEAIARARERKPEPARISASYLNCIVGDIIAERGGSRVRWNTAGPVRQARVEYR